MTLICGMVVWIAKCPQGNARSQFTCAPESVIKTEHIEEFVEEAETTETANMDESEIGGYDNDER